VGVVRMRVEIKLLSSQTSSSLWLPPQEAQSQVSRRTLDREM